MLRRLSKLVTDEGESLPALGLREREEQHGKLVDLSAFQRDILPLIQDVPLCQLQQATGLSLRYVSLIRRGNGRHTRAIGRRWSGPPG